MGGAEDDVVVSLLHWIERYMQSGNEGQGWAKLMGHVNTRWVVAEWKPTTKNGCVGRERECKDIGREVRSLDNGQWHRITGG
ncbi:hypothetical protein DdX_02426 [Ditylenchus destructor]|uniref:Uncharacterized protein n=1 Tax=Ditylenchus destructor TaxID=166010 RepID=A0AAD4RC04_9BILA|nr:hypothetical protein DdX_02426 [Ditylenchus destructor]